MFRVLFSFLLILLLSVLNLDGARAGEIPASSVVTVVSLDSQGQPLRQGLGVIISPECLLLTSLEIFLNSEGGIIKTALGDLHLIEGVVQLDRLQDLALLKVNAEGLVASPVSPKGRLKVAEPLWLPAKPGSKINFQEVTAQAVYPISPRLELLELQLANREVAPGTPVFNQAGEIVGMAHLLTSQPDKEKSSLYFLLLNRSALPSAEKASEALQSFEEASELAQTKSPEEFFWQAIAAMVKHNWALALGKFNDAIKMDKNNPEAYYGRAQARFFEKDYRGAEKDLEKAIKLLPSYGRAYFWLAKTREKLGDKAGEMQAYEMTVKINEDFPEAYFRLGQLAYNDREFDRAAQFFGKAQAGFPEAAKSWWYLGIINQSRQNPLDAVENFKQAIALNPQFFEANLSLGKLFLKAGEQPQEAVKILSQAVQQRPQNGEARLYLALAQLVTWNRGGALENYFVLRDINPRLAARLNHILQQRR